MDYLVPDRFNFGYGLSVELAEHIVAMAPDLVITVDSGISCLKGIERVKAAGIKSLSPTTIYKVNNYPTLMLLLTPIVTIVLSHQNR